MANLDKRFIDLDFSSINGLKAEDIPYSALLNIKEAIDALNVVKNGVDSGETFTIPDNHHKIVMDPYYVDGDLIVDGDLLIAL